MVFRLDHQRWIHPRYAFFLPVKVLSRVFRGKFTAGLKRAFRKRQLIFPGSLQPLANRNEHSALFFVRSSAKTGSCTPSRLSAVRSTFFITWPATPIASPSPIIGSLRFADGQVTFRWKDYAHGSKQKLMTVTAEEFLRRFLLHVLPHGFVRIRFFGFLANRRRKSLLPLCRQLLQMTTPGCSDSAQPKACSRAVWQCPRCGGSMLLAPALYRCGTQLAIGGTEDSL